MDTADVGLWGESSRPSQNRPEAMHSGIGLHGDVCYKGKVSNIHFGGG